MVGGDGEVAEYDVTTSRHCASTNCVQPSLTSVRYAMVSRREIRARSPPPFCSSRCVVEEPNSCCSSHCSASASSSVSVTWPPRPSREERLQCSSNRENVPTMPRERSHANSKRTAAAGDDAEGDEEVPIRPSWSWDVTNATMER